METRHYSPVDRLLCSLDDGIRTVFGRPVPTDRPQPRSYRRPSELPAPQRRRSGRLMRVNHSGEVAAQGLYHGQALFARTQDIKEQMARSAAEESDHLVWCERRVRELGSRLSYLNPVWYGGSVVIGAAASAAGDRWSLGFLAETERQVVRHLNRHLRRLPYDDHESRAILDQMQKDEARHATAALNAGAAELPKPVKTMMALVSRIMTGVAYWV